MQLNFEAQVRRIYCRRMLVGLAVCAALISGPSAAQAQRNASRAFPDRIPNSPILGALNLQNLAPNPSFEQGTGLPSGWATELDNGSASFVWDGSTSHSGSRSLAIQNLIPQSSQCNPYVLPCAAANWISSQYISIDPTHDYVISAWYKNTTSSPYVSFLAIMWGEQTAALGSTGIWGMGPSNEWKFRTATISSQTLQQSFPGVNRIQLYFGITQENLESGGVWIDDVSIVQYTKDDPFLNLPVQYTDFSVAANGNTGDHPGRVNSWLDHQTPDYSLDGYLYRWDGSRLPDPADKACQSGYNCYDGHNGIDFSHDKSLTNENIYAAANGTVFGLVNTCQVGNVACGGGYGNHVWIDHGNGYATLYGHLSTVLVASGAVITDRLAQPLGVMGSTGRSTGTHLHFGLYYDENQNGQWTENEAVDPYGWRGASVDPWNLLSRYVWLHSLFAQQQVGSGGGSVSSPSGIKTVTIPSGALDSPVTLEMWDTPPVAAPSAELRSSGSAFLMQVLEWLTISSSGPSVLATSSTTAFNTPVTLTVNFDASSLPHMDISQLSLYQWDNFGQAWTPLLTTLDAPSGRASAQTSQTGEFDLQGPLVCPADTLEPNDNYDGAHLLQPVGASRSGLFDISDDEDWFQFDAASGSVYLIKTANLAADVNTVLEIYDSDGVALLAADDNGGGGKASSLTWRSPKDGAYFVRVGQALGSAYGCSASYDLSIAFAPSFTANPASRDYGVVKVGTTSAGKLFTVKNTGSADLIIGTISLAGVNRDQFQIATNGCSRQTLIPDGSCSLAVKFKPTTAGTKAAYLNFSDNAVGHPHKVSLSGKAGVELVLNGGFNVYPTSTARVPTNWRAANLTATDGKSTVVKAEGIASVRMGNTSARSKTLTQTRYVTGASGSSFLLSLWVKGQNIPGTAGLAQAQVALYNGTILVDKKLVTFATGTYGFTRKQLSFTASEAYTKVVIKLIYSKGTGTIWLDGLSLLRSP